MDEHELLEIIEDRVEELYERSHNMIEVDGGIDYSEGYETGYHDGFCRALDEVLDILDELEE